MPIQVARSSMPSYEEYCDEIKELWDSHWLTNMGIKHKTLETQLESYLGVENLVLFTNGHLALENIIAAMGLSGEVITTPFTFASTTHAIVRNGLIPVFCDIDPDSYTINPNQIESLITDKTSAIIPVHVFGNVCNVTEINKIAKKHNLKVIYDAAHVFGVQFDGKGIGTFGDASIFSFHATKVFNTIEGGAVVTKHKSLVPQLNNLKNFGITGPESVEMIGGNAKMNEFQAAMGICNLRHIEEEIAKRKLVFERYSEILGGHEDIILSPVQVGVRPNYAYYPVVFRGKKSRDKIFDQLKVHDVIARKYFYPLTNTFDCYKGKHFVGQTPVANEISQNVLCLPMYADLSLSDVENICSIILS